MVKMYKQLTKLTLITSFGKGSAKPLRKAAFLLVSSVIGLLIGGLMVARQLERLSLARDLPPNIIFVTTATIIFITLGFLILPMVDFIDGRQSITSRNLLVLPLRRAQRWFVMILP